MANLAASRAAYRGLLPQHLLDGLSVERRAEGWRETVSSRDGHTLLAADAASDQVVGFVNVGPSRDDDAESNVGELRAIYVLEGWWDTGTGRRLHDAALALLRKDHSEATLWVLETNERARSFYDRRGWRADGAAKRDERDDVVFSEIRYRLLLA